MILGSELELKRVQTAVSKGLGILQKSRRGGINAKVWVKTVFVCLVYWACL